jgi:hypothetical protein
LSRYEGEDFNGGMMKANLAIALFVLTISTTGASAQSASYCTGLCGGKPGGESANTPTVVACYRKCMNGPSSQPTKKKGSN